MQSLLAAPPFPAMMLALGCLVGATGTHLAPERVGPARAITAPTDMAGTSAQVAIIDEAPADMRSAEGSRTIDRSPDGLFYVTARINGRPVRFLVDTGANVTILREADARIIGAAPDRRRVDGVVATAGGNTAMAWAHLADVRIAGQRMRNVKVAVVRGGPGVSLLGQDMLAELGSVRIDNDRLTLAS